MSSLDNDYPRPLWLYVFAQHGCAACAEARPALSQLRLTYPTKIIVVEVHVDMREWSELVNWTPKYTPGYALVDRNGPEKSLIKKTTGTMTYDQLIAWIGKEYFA